jgi:hypothetical protein
MLKWPGLSFAFMSLLICVAGDYGLQSRAAGLAPGKMTLRDYGATIQARISRMQEGEKPDGMMAASRSFFSDTESATAGAGSGAADQTVRVSKGLSSGSGGTCVRRGTTRVCD